MCPGCRLRLIREAYKIVRKEKIGSFHCTSRCVRRAFLCGIDAYSGRDYSHRRQWIAMRLRELARVFAVDVDAWAVMENHLHLLLTRRPDLSSEWPDREVVERWLSVMPPKSRGRVLEVTEASIGAILLHRSRVETFRRRLADLAWFHSLLKQPLAAMANREDGCTGHFWDGRYIPEPVVDGAHLLAASVYIDLNPIRANAAANPEQSEFTSVHDRILARQYVEQGLIAQSNIGGAPSYLFRCPLEQVTNADSDGWLTPIKHAENRRGLHPSLDFAEYLTIVDRIGRQVRSGKNGRIDPKLPSILERLDVDVDRFLDAVITGEKLSCVRIDR